jgi:hypothetical protein
VIALEMHQSSRSSLNYLSIGGWNESIVADPDEIMWAHSYCSEHWEIYLNSLQFSDTMLIESDFGLRARISIEEKGIIVGQTLWGPIREILEYKNNNLVCQEGNNKTRDFENMRSYCYYEGNCFNLGLNSLFLTFPDGKELEIIKG